MPAHCGVRGERFGLQKSENMMPIRRVGFMPATGGTCRDTCSGGCCRELRAVSCAPQGQPIFENTRHEKKKHSKKRTGSGMGPIAGIVIAYARHHLNEKIIDLDGWRKARISAEEFQKTIISEKELAKYDPVHGAYVFGQNHLSVLVEQLGDLPALRKLVDVYARAEDEYLPS